MNTQINGFQMAYEDKGSGQPLLLIHGYPLNRQMWSPQITGLSTAARIIAPDLRGHGESQAGGVGVPASGAYSMDMHAGDCAALLDALGITERVVVCGLSMGGYIALAFYRNYPERVAGLVLTATRAGADSPQGKIGRDQAADLARRSGAGAIAAGMLPKMLAPGTYKNQPDLVDQVNEIMLATSVDGIIGDLLGMRDRPDSTPLLAQIQQPALVIHGTDDQILPVAEAEQTHSHLANGRLELIPAAGHLLNLEQPEMVNQALLNYLNTI